MSAVAAVRMQEAPKEINIAETATGAIDSIMQMLSDDAEPPKNLIMVKQAVQDGKEPQEIGAALYLLMTEQVLDYDMSEGQMVPTAVDCARRAISPTAGRAPCPRRALAALVSRRKTRRRQDGRPKGEGEARIHLHVRHQHVQARLHLAGCAQGRGDQQRGEPCGHGWPGV